MRLFVAFDVPSDLRDAYARVRDDASDLPVQVLWSPPDQYHCTLRFIGEVGADQASAFRTALQEVTVPSFECRPYGLDVLPGRSRPRVLIAGLRLTDPLKQLQRAVTGRLESRGLAPEDRSYKPHVTLARLRQADPKAVHAFLKSQDISFPSFPVTEFHLYESTTSPEGATHEVLDTYPLQHAA